MPELEIYLSNWQKIFVKFQNLICLDKFCNSGQFDSEKAVSWRDSQTTHGGIGKKYGLQVPSRTPQLSQYLYLHLFCASICI